MDKENKVAIQPSIKVILNADYREIWFITFILTFIVESRKLKFGTENKLLFFHKPFTDITPVIFNNQKINSGE